MGLKVFAVDIDGTLTENGSKVNLYALSLLRALEQLGYKVIFVTGRSSIEAYILAVFAGTSKIAVGENGGVVTISPSEHILLADRTACERAYNILKARIDSVRIKQVFPRMTEVVLERTFSIDEASRILEQEGLDVKIVDSMYAYHINEKGIDKTKGLKKALDILGLSLDECIAIGDSATDVPLFKACAYSIAIGNADDHVKSMAKVSVKDKDGNGLTEAIYYAINNLI